MRCLRRRWPGLPSRDAKSKGIELGKKAAAGIIALRANDGSNAPESYRPATTPGVYVPTAIPIEFDQLQDDAVGDEHRLAIPPGAASGTHLGSLDPGPERNSRRSAATPAPSAPPSRRRSARFWFFTGPRTYNPIVRQIALARKMDLVDCARLYALTSMAGGDAFIAVFDGKYAYNLWRPVTAIRNADLTSNPATPREASWLPLGTTPMHPEYPCAHCIVAAAVSTVLQNVVGNEVGEITLASPTAPGVTRKWTRLQDYSDEVSNARIYAGFHYRFSTEVGKDMGKKIGDLAVRTQMLGRRGRCPAEALIEASRRTVAHERSAVRGHRPGVASISTTGCILLHQGDAIDLDIERPKPFGHAHEDARRRIFRKIARVDRVDGGEVRRPRCSRRCTSSRSAAMCPRFPGTVSIAQGRVRSDARSDR